MSDAPPPEQLDAAADGAFSGKLADPADTLTKRGGKGHVVYERDALEAIVITLTNERDTMEEMSRHHAGVALDVIAELIQLRAERDALRKAVGEMHKAILTLRTPSLACDGDNLEYIIGFKSGYTEALQDVSYALDAALAVQP